MAKLSDSARINMAVLAPELIGAPLATLGAVYCMEKVPHQMKSLSDTVSKHIVLPHLEKFEYFAKGLRRAHKEYDEKRNAQRIARGEPPLPYAPETREERAFEISDGMVKTFLALGADFAATLGLQSMLARALKAPMQPFKTAATELTVHLGIMALMPTLFAKFSENTHYGIGRAMEHKLGIDKEKADERGRALTYVSLPGYGAAIASLLYAHGMGKNKGR